MRFNANATLLACLLCLAAAARAAALQTEYLPRVSPSGAPGSPGMKVVSGLASVALAPGVSTAAASAALDAAGFELDLARAAGRWRPVRFKSPRPVAQALAALSAMPAVVAAAEPDKVYSVRRVPNDPYISSQYALAQVQAFGAWEYETGTSSRVTVAVIDTGIETSHPEFSGKFAAAANQFCDPGANKLGGGDNAACVAEPSASPACYHGTAVAGVAAANGDNASGIAGMSWGPEARLVSLRVFRVGDCTSDCGGAGCETDDWAMADALGWAADQHNSAAYGKVVANMSLGCPYAVCGGCSGVMQAAVNYAAGKDVLVFAAAGNGSDSRLDSPADCPGVIPVGATDSQDRLAYFSTSFGTMTAAGVTAPGYDVYTTNSGGGYTSATGTSFASPMAAGLAALLWSAKPAASAAQVRDYILNTADDLGAAGADASFGRGRINALRAMRYALTGTTASAADGKAAAYPNPFRPSRDRLVTFTVPASLLGPGLEARVYTQEGEQVKKLSALSWDGRNESGHPVASGVYLLLVKTDKGTAVGKFAVLK